MRIHRAILPVFLFILPLSASAIFEKRAPLPESLLTATEDSVPMMTVSGGQLAIKFKVNLYKEFAAPIDKISLRPNDTSKFIIEGFKISPLTTFKDPVSLVDVQAIQGDAELIVNVRVPKDLPPGKQSMLLQLNYSACVTAYCLVPKSTFMNVNFIVEPLIPTLSSTLAHLKRIWIGAFPDSKKQYTICAVFLLAGILILFVPILPSLRKLRIAVGLSVLALGFLGFSFSMAEPEIAATRQVASVDHAETTEHEAIKFIPFTKEALEQATRDQKPVIIDFWATWCEACILLEKHTYTDPEVVNASKHFVNLQVDATNPSEFVEELKLHYGIKSLPTVIFIDRNGVRKQELTLISFEEAAKFISRMKILL